MIQVLADILHKWYWSTAHVCPCINREIYVTNLSSENNLLRFQLNAPVIIRAKVHTDDNWSIQLKCWQVLPDDTEAFSQNIYKLFSELKLVRDYLSLDAATN